MFQMNMNKHRQILLNADILNLCGHSTVDILVWTGLLQQEPSKPTVHSLTSVFMHALGKIDIYLFIYV